MMSRTVSAKKRALPRMPLVVVVDRGTASAAEIVTAALRDNKRAKVVGTRTFGKASIQAVVAVPGGGAVKLTSRPIARPTGSTSTVTASARMSPVRTQLLVHAVAIAKKL